MSETTEHGGGAEPAQGTALKLWTHKLLGEFCACYGEAWPADTCNAEKAKLAAWVAENPPPGFVARSVYESAVHGRAEFRQALREARTVPPAAAPVGELRAKLINAALQYYMVGDRIMVSIDAAIAALAAAPVTGDRETAGVEPHEGDDILIRGRFVRWCDPLPTDWNPPAHSTERVAQVEIEHPAVGWSSVHEAVASSVIALATPPSGGGDHAGAEASSPGEWHIWTGGPCPVSADTIIEPVFREGCEPNNDPCPAGDLRWTHNSLEDGNGGDIIAYRLAATARPAGAEGSAEVQNAQRGLSDLMNESLQVVEASLAAEPVTSGKLRWRPMDEAPKTGAWVFCVGPGYGVENIDAFWARYDDAPLRDGEDPSLMWELGHGDYTTTDALADCVWTEDSPLAAPPARDASDGEGG